MSDDSSLDFSDRERLQLQQALRECEILRELSDLLASSFDLAQILQIFVRRTSEVCNVKRCTIWLFDETHNQFAPKTYFLASPDLQTKADKTRERLWFSSTLSTLLLQAPFIQQITQEGTLAIHDLQTIPAMQSFAHSFLIRSILFVTLKREGRIVGILSLDSPANIQDFSDSTRQLVQAIGQQAAVAIDNARLFKQAQNESKRADRLARRAQAIYEVAIAVNSNEDLSTILGIATQHLVSGLEADGGTIMLLDDGALLVASSTTRPTYVSASPALIDLPCCAKALSDGTSHFYTQNQLTGIESEWYRRFDLSNFLVIPLLSSTQQKYGQKKKQAIAEEEKQCVGFAFVNYNTTRQPAKGQLAFAQDIATQCALAIEKHWLLANAQQIAQVATERASTLDAVFNAMTEGVIGLDLDGEIIVSNQTASRFLNVPLNTKQQLAAFLHHHPIFTTQHHTLAYEDFPLTRALHGETIRGERFITRRADNSERTLEVNVAPLHDEESRRIGYVGAFRDVTEQVRVEQRIRDVLNVMLNAAEVLAGVSEIQEMMRRVLTMTLSALNVERGFIHLYNADRHIFTPLLSVGFPDDPSTYWNVEQQLWLAPDFPTSKEPYSSLVAGHATLITMDQRLDHKEVGHTGTCLVVPIVYNEQLLGAIILDSTVFFTQAANPTITQPRQIYREFTLWDITVAEGIAQFAGLAMEQARWQSEAISARTSEAQIRESSAMKDEFLSITAHEFRSPLTVIQAHSQMMARIMRRIEEMPRRDRLQESITAIEEQTHLLTEIVNTFLEVTRLNKGQITLKKEAVNLSELLKQEVTRQSTTTAKHTLRYKSLSNIDTNYVCGDQARLQQIFVNLLQNAIKYSPHGGPITVSLQQITNEEGDTFLETRVTDRGIGVPSDAQPHLFERFYRAPNVDGGKTKGVGLGLYVVAEFIHLHSGTITVESSGEYGEGSTFIVRLPLLQESSNTEHA